MGQILLWAFVVYLLYNFIFRFVIPLVRVTRQVKRQVRDFKEQANAAGGFQPGGFQSGGFPNGSFPNGKFPNGGFQNGPFTQSGPQQASQHKAFDDTSSARKTAAKPDPATPKKDDYIDFEEIS